MTKIEEFVKLITGRFDNKEQFDAMKKAGKTYPYVKCSKYFFWRY